MADDESAIHRTLHQLLDAFNRHDLDDIMEHFAEAATLEMRRGPHPWGSAS
jgi:ketosteroid isomerase-like protein